MSRIETPPEDPGGPDGMAMVHVQIAVDENAPPAAAVRRWAVAAAGAAAGELTVRIAGEDEVSALNLRYREKAGPTNVLSFPAQAPGVEWPEAAGGPRPLGDVLVCADVVAREALDQDKSLEAHYAHMVVHGVLHLRGFDHERPSQAQTMEGEERRVLSLLGFGDPYAVAARARAGNARRCSGEVLA